MKISIHGRFWQPFFFSIRRDRAQEKYISQHLRLTWSMTRKLHMLREPWINGGDFPTPLQCRFSISRFLQQILPFQRTGIRRIGRGIITFRAHQPRGEEEKSIKTSHVITASRAASFGAQGRSENEKKKAQGNLLRPWIAAPHSRGALEPGIS